MTVMSPRLAAKPRSSAGTKTGKLSAIERLATPSTKQSATSNHGTKRAIGKNPSHDRTLASATPPRQVPRRGGRQSEQSIGEVGHSAGLQRAAAFGQWRLCR